MCFYTIHICIHVKLVRKKEICMWQERKHKHNVSFLSLCMFFACFRDGIEAPKADSLRLDLKHDPAEEVGGVGRAAGADYDDGNAWRLKKPNPSALRVKVPKYGAYMVSVLGIVIMT